MRKWLIEQKWKSARIKYLKCRVGQAKYVFVSVCIPINVMTVKEENEEILETVG